MSYAKNPNVLPIVLPIARKQNKFDDTAKLPVEGKQPFDKFQNLKTTSSYRFFCLYTNQIRMMWK